MAVYAGNIPMMKTIFMLLGTVVMVHGEILRVSKVFPMRGQNTEDLRYTKDGRLNSIIHVDKRTVVTGKDVKEARVLPKETGVIEVKLTEEGSKRLAAATKDAGGRLRLAIIVNDVVESIPLVKGQVKGSFWIAGLEYLGKEELQKLAEAMMKVEEEDEKKNEDPPPPPPSPKY
jgi:preprotein translocase subunit SecD